MSDITYTTVNVADLDTAFSDYIDLAVATRGGKIITTSDEWFAETGNLLTATPPISRKGHFTANGAWFDGWETRRHNPSFDWCVIQLGYPGTIAGFEVDTAYFTGNHSPFVSVEGYLDEATFATSTTSSTGEVDTEKNSITQRSDAEWAGLNWVPVLPKVILNPSARHGFKLDQVSKQAFTHIRFRMYPDGGVARLRVYGSVQKVIPEDVHEIFDLASAATGSLVETFSDAHYGHPSNLLLKGRGTDMSDGWETKRSRSPGHIDWCTIKLGTPGFASLIEIDTAHYMGNPPKAVTIQGFQSGSEEPVVLIENEAVKPHLQHFFNVPQDLQTIKIESLKIIMIPDGGIKRVRVFGGQELPLAPIPEGSPIGQRQLLPDEETWNLLTIQAEPITNAAFAPWGTVIETPIYDPNSIKVNQGTAEKFSHLGQFVNLRSFSGDSINHNNRSNPDLPPAEANIAIFKCYKPVETKEIGVKLLERHAYSSQMFVPMGGDGNGGFVVVVAKDRQSDGNPDLKTLKAFTVKNSQGINYKPNVWHHPMIVTGRPVTFLTITHESGVGKDDCHEYWFTKESGKEGGAAAIVRI